MNYSAHEALLNYIISYIKKDSFNLILSKMKKLAYLNQDKVSSLTTFVLSDISNYQFDTDNLKYFYDHTEPAAFKMIFIVSCGIEKKEVFRFIGCMEGKGKINSKTISHATWYDRFGEEYIYSVENLSDVIIKNCRVIDLSNEKNPFPGLDENAEWDWGDSESDIILTTIQNSILIESLNERFNIHNTSNKSFIMSRERAHIFARAYNCDALVAQLIYYGLEFATPAFDEVGEQFLSQVLSDYSKVDYAEDMIKGVLCQIKSSKKAIVLKGLRDILEGNDNQSNEVSAVLLAKKIYDFSDAYGNFENREKINEILSKEIEKMILEGMNDVNEIYTKALEISLPKFSEYKLKQKKKVNLDNLKYLTSMYEYYLQNYEKLPGELYHYRYPGGYDKNDAEYLQQNYMKIPRTYIKYLFPKYQNDPKRIVAYYVASCSETHLINFYENLKNNNNE